MKEQPSAMAWLAYTVAFAAELVALYYIVFVSTLVASTKSLQVVLSVIIGLLLVLFWGLFMAPKAKRRLKRLYYYVAKALLYGIAAYSMYFNAGPMFMGIFILVAIIDELYLYQLESKQ